MTQILPLKQTLGKKMSILLRCACWRGILVSTYRDILDYESVSRPQEIKQELL